MTPEKEAFEASLDQYSGMMQAQDALRRAFIPWISGEYPEAKTIGDVVTAMSLEKADVSN